MRSLSILAVALACLACLACNDTTDAPVADYDADWGADTLLTAGKADGIFDITAPLEFGGQQAGQVGGTQVNVYKMKLLAGDEITLTATVTSGDLNPHVSLYYGTSTYLASRSWNLDAGKLTKAYAAPYSGDYLIAVRAYRGQGEGKYILGATCDAGPCNGDFVEPEEADDFGIGEASDCIIATRTCAFDRMGRYNGAVGPARASKLFDECLAEQTPGGGLSCSRACAGDRQALCDSVIKGIEFYADQSEACMEELNSCFYDCESVGDDWGYDWDAEFYGTPAAMCWDGIWNGDCDSYARNHQSCGGSAYKADSHRACYAYCESTTGAWIDDLDVMCDEACEDLCDGEVAACETACAGNDDTDCVSECLDFNEVWGCN